MSDTRRNVRVPLDQFTEWMIDLNERYWHIESQKHLERDKSARTSSYSKNYRFTKGLKNTQYNLQKKNDQLSLKEALDGHID